MWRRKGPVNLSDYRSVLRSTGDVAVGAYARHQRRRQFLVAVAGLALIGGAAWIGAAILPRDPGVSGATYPVAVECQQCKYRGVLHLAAGAVAYPLACPKCRQRACYKLWECGSCGYQFVNKKGPQQAVTCPRCGGRNVGTAETVRDPAASAPVHPQATDANGR
jgi:hypothetical protein